MNPRRSQLRSLRATLPGAGCAAFIVALCFAGGCDPGVSLETPTDADAGIVIADAASPDARIVVADAGPDDAGDVADSHDPPDADAEDASAGDACPDGGCPVVCPSTQIACDGICIDPASDRDHCGATLGCGESDAGAPGASCAAGMVCSSGSCEASCAAALSTCGGTCVDAQHDPAHCGSCDKACNTAHATNVCVSGECALLACDPGFDRCPPRWTGLPPTSCSLFASDVANCGYCGHECVLANATPACTASACAIVSCNAGFTDCNDDPSDGCETAGTTCPTPKKIFVTSAVYPASMGGHAGADANCAAAATGAGLTGTFLAWVSDDATSPASRFAHTTVPYALVDGTIVANGWEGLVSGSLRHAIDKTESGGAPAPPQVGICNVWTGTSNSGTPMYGSCSSWSSVTQAAGNSGCAGNSSLSNGAWTCQCSGAVCNAQAALYCVEQ
ncbi:MAG: Tryptophan synthase alpha chain [Labilithrix sp.]|nr:Tryptophan synthase alpha chain [Labilithrix sp.]